MRGVVIVVGCLSLSLAGPLGAQQIADPAVWRQVIQEQRSIDVQAAYADRATPSLATGGAVGAGIGALAGGALGLGLGVALTRCDDQDGCVGDYANWAFNGAVVGSSVLIPIGVHLANRRQGSAAPAMLASVGVGAVGLGVFWGVQRSEGPDAVMIASVVATPVIQLLGSMAIERATSRRQR
jgi:hypothetical protein